MNLTQLIKYSDNTEKHFIAGSKEAEIDYLKFHFKRFRELNGILEKFSEGKLLDIGTTPFTFFLSENSKHKVFGYDYNDLQKERCDRYNVSFQSGDLTTDKLPYEKNFFDYILFAEVFEHLHADPVRILDAFHNILKPGGFLILGTPNLASLANRLKLLFNKPILEYPTWDAEVHGHDRLYVVSELKNYLAQSGFAISKTIYSDSLDFYSHSHGLSGKGALKSAVKAISSPLRFVFKSLNGTILIIAQKPGKA